MEDNFKKKFFVVTAFLGIYILLTSPLLIEKFINSSQKSHVIINGKKFYESDLKDHSEYIKLKKNWLESLRQVFQTFALEESLRLEASENKLTEEELVRKNLPFPTDAEIQMVYEEFKDSELQGRPLTEVRSSIVAYLSQMKEAEFKQNLLQKYKFELKLEEAPTPPKKIVKENDNPSLGPKDAKVTIVEFSDFECPYCQRSQIVNKKLREKYKEEIRWVFMDYPLPNHRNAMLAHAAANCAISQNKFWEMFELLFQNTRNLSRDSILGIASSLNIKTPEYEKCLEDSKTIQEIQNDISEGQKLGVNGTPAFFINGIMVEGAAPIETFEKIIEQELK